MSPSHEEFSEVGAFEPHELKRVLGAFEAKGIPFELETDEGQLTSEGRTFQTELGMFPPGSRFIVFVPTGSLAPAQAIVAGLYPR